VDGLAGDRVYKGIGDCIKKTYKNEGFHGFFRGMPTTLIRSFPVNAVTFSVVTWMLRCFEPSSESSSVTYQDASSLQRQESLVNTTSFTHDHHMLNRMHQNDWLADFQWKPLVPVLVLGGIGPASVTIPIRNYTIYCRCNDWLNGAMNSLVHLSQVHNIGAAWPPTVTDAASANSTVEKQAGLLFDCRCKDADEKDNTRLPMHVSPATDSSYATAAAAAVAVCSAVCCPAVEELA
jgi:hypothetical protein